jgi:ADP-heptose:LPS heptosyltransferase
MAMLTTKVTPFSDRVLIVRIDAIGDFVLWLDAAQAIVKHYKAHGKRVILVANDVWATWARELAIFETVIALDRRKFETDLRYRFQLGRAIRKLKCSIAIQPSYSRTREWLLGDAVVRVSGASERIGSSGDTSRIQLWQKRVSDRWYTRLIPSSPEPCMELVRNAEFVRALGQIEFLAKVPNLYEISPLRKDESFIAAMPADLKYYVLFPGASWDGRQWPVASFVATANRLYSKIGWPGVICGGPTDANLAKDICRQSDAPLLNWVGRTDLSQLAAILATAQLLLTNETSATHIAATLGVPTVCILGGGHFGRFMPYQVEQADNRPLPRAVTHPMPCFGCDWNCIYPCTSGSPVPCIDQITTSMVWDAIAGVLGLSV